MKLFDLSNEEMDSEIFSLSNEEITAIKLLSKYETANEEFRELSLENNKTLSAYSDIIDYEIKLENLNISKESNDSELKKAADLLNKISIESGYSDELIEPSLETILERQKGLIGGVKQLSKMFVAKFGENIKRVTLIWNVFKTYDDAKLKQLKSDIENGVLVPKKNIDKKAMSNFITSELLVFYKFNYNTDGKSDDLIEYMKLFIDEITSGDFKNGLLNEKKPKIVIDLISRLKNLDIDPNTITYAMVMRMFSSKLSLMSIAIKDGELLPTHADIEKLKYNNQIIKLDNTKEAIKLLDFGIKSKSDIKQALTISKEALVPAFGAEIVSRLMSRVTGGGSTIVTRIVDNYMAYLTDKIYNFVRYDKLIIKIINLTYEKAKSE